MYLRDGSGGERRQAEFGEYLIGGLAETFFDQCLGRFALKWCNFVLQAFELLREIIGQNIPARGKNLAELDKDGAELLQCPAQALSACQRWSGEQFPR